MKWTASVSVTCRTSLNKGAAGGSDSYQPPAPPSVGSASSGAGSGSALGAALEEDAPSPTGVRGAVAGI